MCSILEMMKIVLTHSHSLARTCHLARLHFLSLYGEVRIVLGNDYYNYHVTRVS